MSNYFHCSKREAHALISKETQNSLALNSVDVYRIEFTFLGLRFCGFECEGLARLQLLYVYSSSLLLQTQNCVILSPGPLDLKHPTVTRWLM